VLAVADGNYSVYATQDAIAWDGDRYGVVFNRSALGFLVSGFFNTVLWTTAQPLARNGFEGTFPRRYASIRRCVKDLTERENRDTGTGAGATEDIYATIEGRDILTGERLTVSGEVVGESLASDEQSAALDIETEEGKRVSVGGRVAALEDIEAHEIYLDRGRAPGEE